MIDIVLPDLTLAHILVILAATGLIWIGSGWLEEAAEQLATYYEFPAVVQGSIIVAVGSSFPELASVVITALAGTFSMGVGAIVGSAIFNILVIPALSGISADGDLETTKTIVYKEAQFYMIAVSGLVVTFSLAIIYAPIPDTSAFTGTLTRPLVLLPLLLYGLYLFIQWQDVTDYKSTNDTSEISIKQSWGRLAMGLITILIAVTALVGSVESLGHTFGIPEFLAGVTIIAVATSLPDLLVSVRSAKSNNAATSLGNVFGSNTFDLLVAIPVGVLIVGSAPIDFAVAAPMFGVLTLATVLLFTVLRTDLEISTIEAYTLLGAYALFIVWIVAETTGVTHLL